MWFDIPMDDWKCERACEVRKSENKRNAYNREHVKWSSEQIDRRNRRIEYASLGYY